MKAIVYEIDPEAYMTISEVADVLKKYQSAPNSPSKDFE